MIRKKVYSWGVQEAIEKELPETVKTALRMSGWNALGIYELARTAIDKENREIRKSKK